MARKRQGEEHPNPDSGPPVFGNPDGDVEMDIEEKLENRRREQARLTVEERRLKDRVSSAVGANPERFVEAGKRLEAEACRRLHLPDPQSHLSEYGAVSLRPHIRELCQQDFDALLRRERVQTAEDVVLLHWLATDPDAADVSPSPTVLASVPWDGNNPLGRMRLRDEIFSPTISEENRVIELVPNGSRARWGQRVTAALDVLGIEPQGLRAPEVHRPSSAAPSFERASTELAKIDRAPALSDNEKRIARVLVNLGEGKGIQRKQLINLHNIPDGSIQRAITNLKASWGVVSSKSGGYYIPKINDIERLKRAIEDDR